MHQLFLNLIVNSLKYKKEGRDPVINIKNAEAKIKGFCRIIVEDNGIGFGPLAPEKIFKSFIQIHEQGEFDGSGLGLAICKNIIDRHKGNITAKGIPKEGALFIITLPIASPDKINKPDDFQ